MRGTMKRSAVRAAKRELDEKRAEATELYHAFDVERRKIIEAGVDLTKDAAAKRRLEELHEPYQRIADATKAAEERFIKLLDRSVGRARDAVEGTAASITLGESGPARGGRSLRSRYTRST